MMMNPDQRGLFRTKKIVGFGHGHAMDVRGIGPFTRRMLLEVDVQAVQQDLHKKAGFHRNRGGFIFGCKVW